LVIAAGLTEFFTPYFDQFDLQRSQTEAAFIPRIPSTEVPDSVAVTGNPTYLGGESVAAKYRHLESCTNELYGGKQEGVIADFHE
jgi:hypothetical protein